MAMWFLVGVLILVELYILGLIREALSLGTVPANPVSWFGYSEFSDIAIDRAALPAVYWSVLLMMGAFAAVLGYLTYLLAVSGGSSVLH